MDGREGEENKETVLFVTSESSQKSHQILAGIKFNL